MSSASSGLRGTVRGGGLPDPEGSEGMGGPASDGLLTDIFICYSRRDASFVRRLSEALEQAGKDIWVDWQDIPPSADWMERIYQAIENARTFVLVLSPDSLESEVCERELAHAAAQNKRILPLVAENVDPRMVPAAAARHQWVSFTSDGGFEGALPKLFDALETDPEWVAEHTEWLHRARGWEKQGRDKSLLLRGRDLRAAEGWLAKDQPGRNPEPTALQREYVHASRSAASRRQRFVIAATATALVVSIVLTVVALIQRNEAIEQKRLAQAQAVAATAEQVLDADPLLGTRLAAESVRIAPTEAGDTLLRRVAASINHRVLLDGHSGIVSGASYSPDGERVVTASDDGTARIWDADSGEALETLRGHESSASGVDFNGVNGAEFSPEGDLVVTASEDGTARIWDADGGTALETLRPSGHRVATFDGRPFGVTEAAFNPDGTLVVTASDDGRARIWDVDGGAPVRSLRGHTGGVTSAAFSSDGERVVTAGGDGTARIWDANGGAAIETLRSRRARREARSQYGTFAVTDAAFTPDGKHVVTAESGGAARIWSTTGGGPVETLRGHESGVTAAAFSPDGERVVTAGTDGTARIWDVDSGTAIETLRGHEALREARSQASAAFPEFREPVLDAAFSPDGERVVTASQDQTARIWEPGTRAPTEVLRGHRNFVNDAEFSPDGDLVATASSGGTLSTSQFHVRNSARIWDASDGEMIEKLQGHTAKMNSIAFNPAGNLVVTASDDGVARISQVDGGAVIETLRGGRQTRREGGAQGRQDLPPSQIARARSRANESISDAAFSPDGSRVLTASYPGTGVPGTTRIWSTNGGEPIETLRGHNDGINSAAFSPDGELVVTASNDETARIWGVDGEEPLATLRGHEEWVNSAAFSPDGELVVTAGDDGTARIWDVDSGAALETLRGHQGEVNDADFSPDGGRVVTAGADGTARVWNASGGAPIETLRVTKDEVASASFSPDGARIVAAGIQGFEGTAQIWSCGIACESLPTLLELVPRIAGSIGSAERAEYLPE